MARECPENARKDSTAQYTGRGVSSILWAFSRKQGHVPSIRDDARAKQHNARGVSCKRARVLQFTTRVTSNKDDDSLQGGTLARARRAPAAGSAEVEA
jgi:hypothetical protein